MVPLIKWTGDKIHRLVVLGDQYIRPTYSSIVDTVEVMGDKVFDMCNKFLIIHIHTCIYKLIVIGTLLTGAQL